jgi:hypothetical protein
MVDVQLTIDENANSSLMRNLSEFCASLKDALETDENLEARRFCIEFELVPGLAECLFLAESAGVLADLGVIYASRINCQQEDEWSGST